MRSKTLKIFHAVLFSVTAVSGLLFAGLYLFRPEFMPYHEVAAGRPWTEIEPEFQVLILALMRVSGGGFLATSVAIIIMILLPFRRDIFWPRIAIPAIGLANLVPTLAGTLLVKTQTLATPPYLLVSILIGLLVISLLISLWMKKPVSSYPH